MEILLNGADILKEKNADPERSAPTGTGKMIKVDLPISLKVNPKLNP